MNRNHWHNVRLTVFPTAGQWTRHFSTLLHCALALGLLAAPNGATNLVAASEQDRQAPPNQPSKQDKPAGQAPNAGKDSLRQGMLVQIKLPVTGEVSSQVKQVISRHVESVPLNLDPKKRPVLVLEFDTSNGRNGRGSEFEACLAIARLLTSSKLTRVETVAYIPGPDGIVTDDMEGKLKSELLGHPILIALACSHIAMHVDASMGHAGIDEEFVDQLIVSAYRDIANKRRTMPAEVAVALVDPTSSLYWIRTSDGEMIFGDQARQAQLESEGKVIISSETITEDGTSPQLSSEQLMKYRLLRLRTTARRDIARKFQLQPNSLEGDPTLGKAWSGVRVDLNRPIDQKTVSWMINALKKRWTDETNLVIVWIDAPEADIYESIRLARHLAAYRSNDVRTIAYVPNQAPAAAGLIALACDHLVMGPQATIGGGSVDLKKDQVAELLGTIRELANEKSRDWSLYAAMLDPTLKIMRYKHKDSGQVRLLCEVEHQALKDPKAWLPLSELLMTEGLSGEEAEQNYVARYLASDFQDLKSFYQLTSDPEILQPTLTDRWLEDFAAFLASPMIAFWLIFGAMFFLSSEMSQPGVGVPGLIGACLLLLFFWSQFLDGNAEWFEILLFAVGVICILMELFVIPGFGVFGIGGLLMIVISIVLATQTFVLPNSPEELKQVPYSMAMVIGAAAGSFGAILFFHRFLPHLPVLKRMMLAPPGNDDDDLVELSEREAVVNWSHLKGKRGATVTQLLPAGKARIGDEILDVISDGRMIEKGSEITVVEIAGNLIRVSPVKNPLDDAE